MGTAGSVAHFIDWWVPPALRMPFERLQRARLVVWYLLSGLTVTMALAGGQVAVGSLAAAALPVAAAALLAASLAIVRVLGALRWGAHLGLAAVTGTLTLQPLVQGSVEGAALCWPCVIPFAAILFEGRRAALFWTPLALGVVLFAANRASGSPGVPVVSRELVLLRGLCFIAVLAALGIAMVAQHREAIAEFARAARAKSAFLAAVSHELRTPMSGVLGMTEVLRAGPLPRELVASVDVMARSGETMVRLLNEVLDLAKIEAGALKIFVRPASIVDVLAEAARPWSALAVERGITLDVRPGDGLPATLLLDADRVAQILSQLVGSAVERSTSGGAVRLEARWRPAEGAVAARLFATVSDSGRALSSEVRSWLQAADVDARDLLPPGPALERLGIGLALCRELARLLGASLRLSDTPSGGTEYVFEVEAALGEAPRPSASEALRAAASADTRGRGLALVVDDDPVGRTVTSALLKRAGFETELAADGYAALSAVQRSSYGVVFMDCQMPVMDGVEATRAVRALPGDAGRVTIVALTGEGLPEQIEALRSAGVDAHVLKPLTLRSLERVLAELELTKGPGAAAGRAPARGDEGVAAARVGR